MLVKTDINVFKLDIYIYIYMITLAIIYYIAAIYYFRRLCFKVNFL